MPFLFKNTSPPDVHTLSLHDALPISRAAGCSPASSKCIEASPVVRKGHPRGGLLFCSESSARRRALGARATRALRRREPRVERATPARRTLDDIGGRTRGSRRGRARPGPYAAA